MFNFTKKNGEKAAFYAKYVEVKEMANGSPFTKFQISNKKQNGAYENLKVMVWGEALPLADKDKVEILEVTGADLETKTISAKVKCISTSGNPQPVKVHDRLESMDDDIDIPF